MSQWHVDRLVGAGAYSLQIRDVGAVATNLELMCLQYRDLHGPASALQLLLRLLAKRQADITCGAISSPRGSRQV